MSEIKINEEFLPKPKITTEGVYTKIEYIERTDSLGVNSSNNKIYLKYRNFWGGDVNMEYWYTLRFIQYK